MLRAVISALILAAVGAPAQAAPAANWAVVPAGSSIRFSASMNGQAFTGNFNRWTAQVVFDPANLAGSHVAAIIAMSSARTGDQTRDEALPTDDWFAAKGFPQAKFVSTSIIAAGPGHYVARGQLTIRGVTRPVALPFALAISGNTARMNGTVALDRSVFGIGQGQWKTGEAVALKVQVNIQIVAKRAGK